ncbi:hypothetical protein ACLB2K_044037 [Fragaria x ananassa]
MSASDTPRSRGTTSPFSVTARTKSPFPVSAIVPPPTPLCEKDENGVTFLCHNDSSSADVTSAYSRWRPKPSLWFNVLLKHLHCDVKCHDIAQFLIARKSSSYYKDKDSMWDLGGDDHDSMEQGNIDVLEMATLSLDVSALERIVIDDEMET